jgi:ankyrin repeat protein
VERGADVERVNDNGQTALGSAAFRQDGEIVKLLLRHGAGPSTGARSAWQVANFFGLESMRALLAEQAEQGHREQADARK